MERKKRRKKDWFPKRLGNWSCGRRLGKGGNGSVWSATNTNDGTFGALKILHRRFQNAGSSRFKRFRHEIQLQRRLGRRPGILPILDYSLPDEPCPSAPAWLVTAMAVPIKKALGSNPTLQKVVEAVAEIADALASLHREGVSHRDIKPGNLYRFEDAWVVGDFGLVDFPDKEGITGTGEQVGPHYYIAPEMISGAKDADATKADVYSLGKTLWVLATGQTVPIWDRPIKESHL